MSSFFVFIRYCFVDRCTTCEKGVLIQMVSFLLEFSILENDLNVFKYTLTIYRCSTTLNNKFILIDKKKGEELIFVINYRINALT